MLNQRVLNRWLSEAEACYFAQGAGVMLNQRVLNRWLSEAEACYKFSEAKSAKRERSPRCRVMCPLNAHFLKRSTT